MKEIKKILQQIDGFKSHKGIIYKYPIRNILVGFYIEKIKTNYYLWEFCQPLYVPSDHIRFTFGQRLPNKSGNFIFHFPIESTYSQVTEIINERIDKISKLEIYEVFLEQFGAKASDNIHIEEAIAYTTFYLDPIKSVKLIQTMINKLSTSNNLNSWENEIINRGNHVIKSINSGIGHKTFDEYRLITLKNIGINLSNSYSELF